VSSSVTSGIASAVDSNPRLWDHSTAGCAQAARCSVRKHDIVSWVRCDRAMRLWRMMAMRQSVSFIRVTSTAACCYPFLLSIRVIYVASHLGRLHSVPQSYRFLFLQSAPRCSVQIAFSEVAAGREGGHKPVERAGIASSWRDVRAYKSPSLATALCGACGLLLTAEQAPVTSCRRDSIVGVTDIRSDSSLLSAEISNDWTSSGFARTRNHAMLRTSEQPNLRP
jgi:hypothetical protein